MRKFLWIEIVIVLLCLSLVNCERKPTACPTCKGTGKITKSEQAPLDFKIINTKVTNKGFFKPDYFTDVTIENKGDKDGTFTIFVDFHYKGIGTHTEQAELFVKAHSEGTKRIRYNADKKADDFTCRVQPPVVIQTAELICPTCGGSGLVK